MPVPVMPSSLAGIARFPRARLGNTPTPLDPAPNLGGALGIDLWIKRDDCTGLAFGGNKVRQIEFDFGEAEARGADTVLVTGAVQSNLVRIAAAAAAAWRLGMEAAAVIAEAFLGKEPLAHRLSALGLGHMRHIAGILTGLDNLDLEVARAGGRVDPIDDQVPPGVHRRLGQ